MRHKSYKVIGLMSGSSLDGLDIAYCNFEVIDGEISWQLLEKETIKFDLSEKTESLLSLSPRMVTPFFMNRNAILPPKSETGLPSPP